MACIIQPDLEEVMLYNPQIETFLTVADTGSFSQAAKQLFISPQAVIKQMNSLEESVGLTLLERSPQGVHLTPEGRSLYKDAQYIMQFSRDAVLRAEAAGDAEEFYLRVGTSILTPDAYITDNWATVVKAMPDLQLRIVSFENSREAAREILANLGQHIDMVAGIYSDDFLERNFCAATFLKALPFKVSCSKTHPLATKEVLEISDLEGYTVRHIYIGWSTVVDEMIDTLKNLHPKINFKPFDSYDMDIFNHCANSNELVLAVEKWSTHPLLKTIDVNWDYTINLGILHAIHPTPKVQHVLDIMSEIYNKNKI